MCTRCLGLHQKDLAILCFYDPTIRMTSIATRLFARAIFGIIHGLGRKREQQRAVSFLWHRAVPSQPAEAISCQNHLAINPALVYSILLRTFLGSFRIAMGLPSTRTKGLEANVKIISARSSLRCSATIIRLPMTFKDQRIGHIDVLVKARDQCYQCSRLCNNGSSVHTISSV